jgi:hypothetical protein
MPTTAGVTVCEITAEILWNPILKRRIHGGTILVVAQLRRQDLTSLIPEFYRKMELPDTTRQRRLPIGTITAILN